MLSPALYYFPLLFLLAMITNYNISLYSNFFNLLDWEFFSCYIQSMFYSTLLLVSFNILMFSFYYFNTGSDFYRFFLLLSFFISSMTLLIFHKGPMVLFIGWDGLGVTSYLLVLFYLNSKSICGASTTVMTNRLGDVFLFIFLSSMGLYGSNSVLYSLPPLFLIICSFTKSAQAPFSSWLPMAMSAPTPVSSLVHSSTLVTAGLFLLIKYYFFWGSSNFLMMIFFFGITTMLIASFMALAEKDIKKIIALSTLSQLGFIMTSLGLSYLNMGFFHLITHAYFKSCMFVQVGGSILLNNTAQDGRIYSSSSNMTLSSSLAISCLSLCGFPMLSGFMSKDLVLMGSMSPTISMLLVSLFFLGVFMTFLYSIRIMLYSLSNSNSPTSKLVPFNSYFSSTLMLVVLGVLSGWLIFSNLMLPPIQILFLEKLIPLLYWIFVISISYTLFKSFELTGGMFMQDSIVLSIQKLPLYNFKILDVFHLSLINSMLHIYHTIVHFMYWGKYLFFPIIFLLLPLLSLL